MVNERSAVITCNFHYYVSARVRKSHFTGMGQYGLQFHCASSIVYRAAASYAVTVLSYIIYKAVRFTVCFVCYVSLVFTFVSTDIHFTVFNTVGEVHVCVY